MKREFVGTMELGNKLQITDPCYEKGTWCMLTTVCEPGTYHGYVEIGNYKYDEDDDFRVAAISIYKDDKQVSFDDMFAIGEIGVDAGLAGFFNNKPDFPGDKWIEFLVKAGVFKNKDEYDYGRNHYAVEYGLFSESGFGDGFYDVFTNEERTAFQIVFINEDEREDEEDDNYES